MLLGLFLQGAGLDLITLPNVILALGFLASLAANFFQYRNKRAEVIHKTDLDTIASLERALERAKKDLAAETARADGLAAELSNVKPELVALMAIDIHELLEFARMKRRIAALERELEDLNSELLEGRRIQQQRLLTEGGAK